jgi:hypothetical protein
VYPLGQQSYIFVSNVWCEDEFLAAAAATYIILGKKKKQRRKHKFG